MLSIILTTVIGLAVLSFLIFIHEAGHFITARFFKVKVLEFGIGFPFLGRIFSFKRGETLYSVNWLFFGGFVQLYGEESGSEKLGPESFAAQNVWKRIAIASAGVVVNIVFAVVIFTGLMATSNFKLDMSVPFDISFPFGKQTEYVLITAVEKESPAEQAGLKFLDKVTRIGDRPLEGVSDLQDYVKEHSGEEIFLSVKNLKEETEREVAITPRVDPPPGQGALGIGLDKGIELKYESIVDKTLVGVFHSANLVVLQTVGLKNFIGQSFEEGSLEPIASKASGPVGVVAALGILVQNSGDQALNTLLTLTALISLMLGIGNLLPIPAVDGGRLAFFYIEAITRKKVSAKIENLIHGVGFVVLIGLIVLISINDIIRIINGRLFG
jgi:regulator of sigma E protease